MKTQSKTLLQTLSKTQTIALTSMVEERPIAIQRDKKFTVAQFERIVKQRRVFPTRRFFSHG